MSSLSNSSITAPQGPLPPAPPPKPYFIPIAHVAHSVALLLILLLTTIYGRLHAAPSLVEATSHSTRYLSSILYEWLLLGSVIAGIYYRGAFLKAALRTPVPSFAAASLRGVGIYFAGLFAILAVGAALYETPLRGMHNDAALHALLPQTMPQLALWFLVSLTAGICEELIFRGYLLQQVTAWTGRPILSVLLAGLVFGSIHLYEGLAAILPIAALGIVYGLVVVRLCGDLRAVIVAHTLQDFLTALFAFGRPYAERHAHAVSSVLPAIAANISRLSSFFS